MWPWAAQQSEGGGVVSHLPWEQEDEGASPSPLTKLTYRPWWKIDTASALRGNRDPETRDGLMVESGPRDHVASSAGVPAGVLGRMAPGGLDT